MNNIYSLAILPYKRKRRIEVTINDYYNLSIQQQSIKKIPKAIVNDIAFLNLISIHDNLLLEFQDIALLGKLTITMEEVMDVIFDAVSRNHQLIGLVKPVFISRNLGNMILDIFDKHLETFDINIFLSMPDKIRSQHYHLVTASIKTCIKTLKVLRSSMFWDSYDQSTYSSMLIECLNTHKIEDLKKYIRYIPQRHRPNIINNKLEYSDSIKPSTFNRFVEGFRRRSRRYSNNYNSNNNLPSKSDNNLQYTIDDDQNSYDSFDETYYGINNSDTHPYHNSKY